MIRKLLSLTLGAALFLSPVQAQEGGGEFGVWRRACDDGPCQIYLGLRNPETDETVASIAVVRDADADRGSIYIEMPTLVALPPGVQIEIGEFSQTIPYQFCRADGCMAIAALSPDFITALEDGEAADVVFVRYGSGVGESVRVPVTGFAEAYASLK